MSAFSLASERVFPSPVAQIYFDDGYTLSRFKNHSGTSAEFDAQLLRHSKINIIRANCELRIANCELRIANCELRIANCPAFCLLCQEIPQSIILPQNMRKIY